MSWLGAAEAGERAKKLMPVACMGHADQLQELATIGTAFATIFL
jgi:hypothetical protein